MERRKIIYKSKPYFGYILASTDLLPHYYWFFFEDTAHVKSYGDSIAFKVKDNELVPTRLYCGDENFISVVKQCVESYRKEKQQMQGPRSQDSKLPSNLTGVERKST